MSPELTTHPLARADGSATFTNAFFSVLAAVNGPIEVQRRDELPEESAVEVNVRSSSGPGGPRERCMESVVGALLRGVLLVHVHPRTLVQVTLQVLKESSGRIGKRKGVWDVAVLPALVNAAFLALVDGGLPLGKSVVAGLAVVNDGEGIVVDPDEKQVMECQSAHAMAYDGQGTLLLNESVGHFGLKQWEKVGEALKENCLAAQATPTEDESMVNGDAEASPWLRQALEGKAREGSAWRESG